MIRMSNLFLYFHSSTNEIKNFDCSICACWCREVKQKKNYREISWNSSSVKAINLQIFRVLTACICRWWNVCGCLWRNWIKIYCFLTKMHEENLFRVCWELTIDELNLMIFSCWMICNKQHELHSEIKNL